MQVRLIPRADFEREKAAGGGLLGLREFAPQAGTPYGMVREPLLGAAPASRARRRRGDFAGAVSLDTGEILWQVPLGTVPDRIPFPLFEQGSRTCGRARDRGRARVQRPHRRTASCAPSTSRRAPSCGATGSRPAATRTR